MTKLITFDVWGTLVVPEREKFVTEICRSIAETLRRYYGNVPLSRIVEAFTLTDREVRERRLRELTFIPPEESVKALLCRITQERPTLKLVDEVHDAICRVVESGVAVKPAPGVEELLSRLHRDGHVLGVVSNIVFWRSYATRRLLDKLGLSRYFTVEIYADIVKEVKPSTRMLRAAEREANATLVMHVGDSFSEDVAMALAYRIKAVFIDRRRQMLEYGVRKRVLLGGNLVLVSSLDVLLEEDLYRVILG